MEDNFTLCQGVSVDETPRIWNREGEGMKKVIQCIILPLICVIIAAALVIFYAGGWAI